MYFSAQQIADSTRRYPINEVRCFSQSQSQTSVFLSHKHTDRTLMLQVKAMLERSGISVYIDWLDAGMTSTTSGKTAEILKDKILKYDKFILVATNDAIDSKWCNWELGLGDAAKYAKGKIAILPVKQGDRTWNGSEYLQIYPTIEYEDGESFFSNGTRKSAGAYVVYHKEREKIYIPLEDWLVNHR